MIDQISPADLITWANAQTQLGHEPVVLDVREDWEFAMSAIQPDGLAVLHVPMGQIPQTLEKLKPHQAIACLCHHGARSQHVAQFLAAQGLENIVNIAGGIHAWSQQVDPRVPVY